VPSENRPPRDHDDADHSARRSDGEEATLPTVSGEQLASVLARNGFTRMRKIGTTIWMGQTGGVVAIPDADAVPLDELLKILHSARLSIEELRDAIASVDATK
jgi:hypothetical protein